MCRSNLSLFQSLWKNSFPLSPPYQWIYWQGKNMSFKHLVNTDPPVETNSKVTSMQTTVKKVMSVKKKLFFPEKLRLKSTMNGIVFVVCVPVLSPQFNFSEFYENCCVWFVSWWIFLVGECFDISSQKSLNNQIMASSQGHFQMRHEVTLLLHSFLFSCFFLFVCFFLCRS